MWTYAGFCHQILIAPSHVFKGFSPPRTRCASKNRKSVDRAEQRFSIGKNHRNPKWRRAPTMRRKKLKRRKITLTISPFAICSIAFTFDLPKAWRKYFYHRIKYKRRWDGAMQQVEHIFVSFHSSSSTSTSSFVALTLLLLNSHSISFDLLRKSYFHYLFAFFFSVARFSRSHSPFFCYSVFELRLMRQNAIFSYRCISRLSHDDPIRVAFRSSPISFATDHINFLCFVLDSQVFFSFTLSAAVKTFSSFFSNDKIHLFRSSVSTLFYFLFFSPFCPSNSASCVQHSHWVSIIFRQ